MLSGCVAPVAIAGDNVSRSNGEKRAASDLLYEHLKAREIFFEPRPKSPSKRTSSTHAIHEPAQSVMNAVEYCLLHGLKLAGPEHPAILCTQESLSYGALVARVSQFAAGLREAGVRPNDRVGMLMLDTPDLIALHLGAVAAGAIAVAMSSRASAAELAQILAIVRPAAVVVDAEFASVTAGERQWSTATAMWESARNITSGCSAVPAWTACSPLHASTSPTQSATCSPRFGLAQATSCLSAGPPRRAWWRWSSASNRR